MKPQETQNLVCIFPLYLGMRYGASKRALGLSKYLISASWFKTRIVSVFNIRWQLAGRLVFALKFRELPVIMFETLGRQSPVITAKLH